MRTAIVVKSVMWLLIVGSPARLVAGTLAEAVPDRPRPTLTVLEPAPLPGDAMRTGPSVVEPIPAPVPPQAEGTGLSPAPQTPCARCGGRWCCGEQCGEMPFGASVCAHMKTQICNGLRDRMVLYHYDFCDGCGPEGDQLNEHGMARLRDIARMFPCSCFQPIVIERTRCNPALDTARRANVVRALNHMNAAVPEYLVVVGKPETPSLGAKEALAIYKNLGKQWMSKGQSDAAINGAGSSSPGTGTTPMLGGSNP
jgi:hypothetical protein